MNLQQIIFPEQSYSFLAGAGISFDSPSNLPVARRIVFSLLDVLNIEDVYRDEFKSKFDAAELRFEQFVEQVVRSYADQELDLFDNLTGCKSPNRIHHILAKSISRGYRTFTTNFDNLIEQAGQNIGCTIESIYDEGSAQAKKNKAVYPLYKLHGTLKDEKGMDRKNSVAAMISSIGKIGEAFALSLSFREILAETLQSSPLFVLGYSGSDDYDILPALAQINHPKQLIWIHHSTNVVETEVCDSSEWDKLPKHLCKVLQDLICSGDWRKEKITILIGNTANIVSEIERILLPPAPIYSPRAAYQIPDYFYEDWKYEHALEAWRDKEFIACVYESLGEYTKAITFLQSALQTVEDLSEKGAQFPLHLDLAGINLRIEKPEAGKYHIDQANKLAEEFGLHGIEKSLLNQYEATYYAETGNLSKAEQMLQNSTVDKTEPYYAGNLFELSRIADLKGEHEQARSLVEEALILNRRTGHLNSVVYCLNYLAKDDLRNERFRDALNSILEAIRICSLTNNYALLANCYEIRALLYRKLGLMGKAFEDLTLATQIYQTRLENVYEITLCYANMASILHRMDCIRKDISSGGVRKIKEQYVEGFGTFYTPADMPTLFKENVSFADGYVVSEGKKLPGLDNEFSGFFPQLSGSSLTEDTSLGLVLEDEFPDETFSSKEFAALATNMAKESGDKNLNDEVLKIISFDSDPEGLSDL